MEKKIDTISTSVRWSKVKHNSFSWCGMDFKQVFYAKFSPKHTMPIFRTMVNED